MRLVSPFTLFLMFVLIDYVPSYAFITTTAKGIWIWQIWTDENGNLDSVISRLKMTGVTWVAVKLGDSNSYWNSPGQDLYTWALKYGGFDSVIVRFHKDGMKVFGWQYIYGTSKWSGTGTLSTEADVTNGILDLPGIDGFIIDAEAEFEVSGMTAVAASYLGNIRAAHQNSFIALTSFARVTGQPIPWTTFLSSCDANMPQSYWALRPTDPATEFDATRSDFETWGQTWINEGYTDAIKPIVPIGCENSEGETNYQMHYGDIQQFCDSVLSVGYAGLSLWEYAGMDTMNWRDYTASWKTLPPTVPQVTNIFPLSTDSVPAYDSIKVGFNVSMDAASIKKAFIISPATNGKLIMNPDLNKWTFAPDTLLIPLTQYTIGIDTSAASLVGVYLTRPYSLKFTTGPINTSGPSVIAASPQDGGTSVSKSYIEFILDEPVHLNSIASQITFIDSTGKSVPFSKDLFQVTGNGLTLVAIRSLINLIPGTRYTMTLEPGVTDYYNVPTKLPYSITFSCDSSEESGGSVIEGFESSIGGWKQPSASTLTYGTDAASSSFGIAYKAYGGFQSGSLQYQFDSTYADCAVQNSQGYNLSSAGSFGMWVFGDDSRNELDFIFGMSTHKVVPVDTINWYGWKFIGMRRDEGDTVTDVFVGFAVRRLQSALLTAGSIYMDDIQVNGKVTGTHSGTVQLIAFQLFQNYPNPFNPMTTISYALPIPTQVNLTVFDVLGRKVSTLVDGKQDAGRHLVNFDGSRLSSGIYFYRLKAGDFIRVKKFVIVK